MSKHNKNDKEDKRKNGSKKSEIEKVVKQADPLSQFHMDKDELRLELVRSQYALRETRRQGQPTGLLVLVNGMEMSGKGAAVTQLRQWVDPRLLNVEATIGMVPPDTQPIWQAHTAKLPRHGNITAYFGNWYADLIVGALTLMQNKKSKLKDKSKDENNSNDDQNNPIEDWKAYLYKQLSILSEFEADLINNHTKLLKCWFHIDKDSLETRLKDCKEDPEWLYHMDWKDKSMVKQFNKVAKVILSEQSDWIVIDGSEYSSEDKTDSRKYKDIGHNEKATEQFCHEVLHATQSAVISSQKADSYQAFDITSRNKNANNTAVAFSWVDIPDKLNDIDDPDMDKSDYQKALSKKQARLVKLLRARNENGEKHHVIFAFEGMDAAGKGGAIKRLVSPLDPREYQIYNISAPNEMELQHPYLWRFWTRLPELPEYPFLTKFSGSDKLNMMSRKDERLSRIAIFDRTWYGRVLVERIEGFASETAWQRAYDEINRMERDLADKGTIVIKYWLAIDKKEQLERFEDREETPHKQFKLTEDDWRNRDKWQDYVQAVADMLARTNTKYAPWHVVATNDKRTARLAVLDHAIKRLESVIELS